MKKIMCDPPSGWKYGFPKPLPEELSYGVSSGSSDTDYGKSVMEWLVDAGYPQHEIDKCGEHFWLRYWQAE